MRQSAAVVMIVGPYGGGEIASDAERGKALAFIRQDTARFLLHQFWYSHRAAMQSDNGVEFGYTWTGMGWTYNWDAQSKTQIGVSEFVVKTGASVSSVRDQSPAKVLP